MFNMQCRIARNMILLPVAMPMEVSAAPTLQATKTEQAGDVHSEVTPTTQPTRNRNASGSNVSRISVYSAIEPVGAFWNR